MGVGAAGLLAHGSTVATNWAAARGHGAPLRIVQVAARGADSSAALVRRADFCRGQIRHGDVAVV